jgi:hypothetical protein
MPYDVMVQKEALSAYFSNSTCRFAISNLGGRGQSSSCSSSCARGIPLPEAVHERFRQKVLLYKEANALLALVTWAKEDPLFEQPLHEYERILFPQSPGTPAAAARLQAVKAAMDDLADLVELARKGEGLLAWARRWFADIGHDETNPITLAKLSNFLSQLHIGVQKTLKQFHDERRWSR